jgi:uncharacterized membrane protein YkoI
MLKNRKRVLFAAIAAIAVLAGGAGIAVATGATGDDDQPLTGATLERATEVALEHTGGGVVTETEVGDDGAAYSVEVQLGDGRQVEVNLDEEFNVTGTEDDDDGPNDGANDDD